ncbi:hypothetical protein BH09PLA1_BH09PLA1_17520 [soil metagenome]
MILRVDEFILQPNRAALDSHDVIRRLIPFGGGQIEVFRAPPRSGGAPRAFLLHFAGNEARAESIVRSIGDLWPSDDVEAWCINYPGSGQTTGDARIAELAPAALAAFDDLHLHAAGRPIYLSGNCLGATVALHVAANREVAGVALQNPAPLRELVRSRFRGPILWLLAYPVSMQIPADLSPAINAAKCHAPAVFIQSLHDRAVPIELQAATLNAYAGETRLLQLDGDHTATPDTAGEKLTDALNWLAGHDAIVAR